MTVEYRDGRPYVRDVPVATVVRLFYQFRGNMDSLKRFFRTLSPQEVEAAMQHYWGNMAAINEAIAEEDRLFRGELFGER